MSDSLERLYQAVIAARDLDPATSRTARLFQRGPSKMAKKLAEEALQVVSAAVRVGPAASRTARLFQRGPSKMAKKLAEEAIEVVIDAVNGKADAVVRESADLLYNLTVLWASAGVTPEDVWREMERREDMLGIAEKLPKMPKVLAGKATVGKVLPKAMPKAMPKATASPAVRRRIVALESRSLRKRH